MVTLRHFEHGDWVVLRENYADIPKDDIIKMVDEWNSLSCNGHFFEMFAVISEGEIVGTVSLYEKDGEIEAGPVIFTGKRGKGFGEKAVTAALEKARAYSYKTAAAHVRKDNTASVRLHEKLGFTVRKEYINSKGREAVEFVKNL